MGIDKPSGLSITALDHDADREGYQRQAGARLQEAALPRRDEEPSHGVEGRRPCAVADERERHVGGGETEDVVLTVHNGGVPIPPELQHAIFEPLVRHTAGLRGDTNSIGLGLFIARAIVTGHEGKISVTSSEADGTTLAVRLPRKATRAAT